MTDSGLPNSNIVSVHKKFSLIEKVIDRIYVMQNLCTKMSLAHMLTNLESANVRNIDIAINLLLSEFRVTGFCGARGKNNPDDISRISDRLSSYPFDENGFSQQGGIHDWSPLLDFL